MTKDEPAAPPLHGQNPDGMIATGDARPEDPEFGRRHELAELLAGARDLASDYDSTITIARHLRGGRRRAGQPADVDAYRVVPLPAGADPHVEAFRPHPL